MLCDYGCGQEAKYQFKNGNWCCSKSHQSCPMVRKKFSESKIGEKNPKGMLGKHHSIKTRKNLSESLSGENHPNFGKHRSEETKKKIGKNQKNKIISKEHREKIGKGVREKLMTPYKDVLVVAKKRGYDLLMTEKEYKDQHPYLKLKCPEGHKIKMRLDGFKSGQNCKYCANKIRGEKTKIRMLNGGAVHALSFSKNIISGPQIELFNLVKEDHPETILEYPCLNYSIDIAIPSSKIAIEYDGSYWHQDQEADDKRQKEIENEGWTFLRYRDYVPSKYKLRKDLNILINENKI